MAHWDIAALRAAERDLRSLGNVAPAVTQAALPGIEDLAIGAIAGRITSYGESWAPLKAGGEPSTSIGHHVQVVAEGTRIKVRLDKIASFHSLGTKHMVARPIKPSEVLGIPQPWRTEITESAERVMSEMVKDR